MVVDEFETTNCEEKSSRAGELRRWVKSYQDACGPARLHHNFVRKHQTLKTTPARALGIENRTWTIRDIVELLPAACHSRRF